MWSSFPRWKSLGNSSCFSCRLSGCCYKVHSQLLNGIQFLCRSVTCSDVDGLVGAMLVNGHDWDELGRISTARMFSFAVMILMRQDIVLYVAQLYCQRLFRRFRHRTWGCRTSLCMHSRCFWWHNLWNAGVHEWWPRDALWFYQSQYGQKDAESPLWGWKPSWVSVLVDFWYIYTCCFCACRFDWTGIMVD